MNSILNFLSKIYNNKKLLLLFIFFISILISLIYLFFLRNIGPEEQRLPATDYLTFYKPTADSILEGKGITIEGALSDKVPPGYPIILAGIFLLSRAIGVPELELISFFNIIITALSCIFLFLIAELVFSKKIALISSILWMSYPFNLWLVKNPNTEIPFIVFLYIGIWFYLFALDRKSIGFIFLAGIVISLSALIRPVSFLLPVLFIFLIFIWFKKNHKKISFLFAGVLLISSLITILPWEGYVFLKTKQIIPLSTSDTAAVVGGLTFAIRPGEGKVTIPKDVLELMEQVKASDLTNKNKVINFFIKELISKPSVLLKLIAIKIGRSWYATSQRWYESQILLIQLLYLLPSVFGVVYGIKIFKDRVGRIAILLSVISYFWVITVFILSILRYMIPAMGLVIIFAAIPIELLITFLSKNSPGPI